MIILLSADAVYTVQLNIHNPSPPAAVRDDTLDLILQRRKSGSTLLLAVGQGLLQNSWRNSYNTAALCRFRIADFICDLSLR